VVSDLFAEQVEPLLRGRFGHPYRFVDTCASTQQLLGDEDPEGAVVVADQQTEGRGRLGRSWVAPAGRAILSSTLLRPAPPVPVWPELSVVAGDAVAAAVREQTGLPAALGRPNDVLVAGRKLAGVLAEARGGLVVLGIGVNVNQRADELPTDTPKPPTSLFVELGGPVERAPLLATILFEVERHYDEWQEVHR